MKKIVIIILVLISLISLSAAYASENITDTQDYTSLENDNNELSNVELSSDNEYNNTEQKTFEDIENLISASQDGDTIELEGTYIGNGDSIYFYKSLTILGINNGATLDARNLSRILMNSGNLTFKNINFINGNGLESYGGAIYNTGYLTVINCTFASNYAENGGAILNKGSLTVDDCTFSKNSVKDYGTAIFCRENCNITITNSIFKDNLCPSTLIDCYGCFFTANNVTVMSNIFTGYRHLALYLMESGINISNSKFYNSIDMPKSYGSLTNGYFEEGSLNIPLNIENNTFKNCNIKYQKDNGTMSNNIFENSSLEILSINATLKGSVFKNLNVCPVQVFTNLTNIDSCTFENLTEAVMFYNYHIDFNVINSTFKNISDTPINMKMSSIPDNNSIVIDGCKFFNSESGLRLSGNYITILNCEFGDIKTRAIDSYGHNQYVNNCSFENTPTGIYMLGVYNWGGNYVNAENIEIVNSNFKNSTFAIFIHAEKLTSVNCTFDSIQTGIKNAGLSSSIFNCSFLNSYISIDLNFNDPNDAVNIIDGCKFINNSYRKGFIESPIILRWCKQTVISNSIFINNTVNEGTVISYHSSSILLVNNSKFINNTALDRGGAISTSGPTKILNSLFQYNKAPIGSSISFDLVDDILIENCTFSDNVAKNNIDVSGYSELNITQTGYYFGDIVLKVSYNDKFTEKPMYNAQLYAFIPKWKQNLFTNHAEYHTLTDTVFRPSKEGKFTINIASLKVGTYNFAVLDDESRKEQIIKITVNKAPAKISAAKSTKSYDPNAYYVVKVLNSKTQKGIANLKVTVSVSGKKITAVSDKNGQAKFSLSKFALGTNKLQISVSDSNVNSAKATSTLKINKAKTVISAPKVTAKYKKSAYFKVTVKTASKKAVKNTKVKVKIDSKTYNLKTNSKGIVQINTKSLKKGTHKVTVSSGDSRLTMSKKSTIIIK